MYEICSFCVQCLADIAHTLLKIAPYDPGTMKSVGLKRSALTFNSNYRFM